jgi:membrane dipeptidase
MQMKQGNGQSRRTLLQGLTAAGGAAWLGPSMLANAWGQEAAIDPRVAKIVADTISVDMHNHDGQPTFAKAPADRKPDPTGVDLPGEMKKAGLSAICLTYAVDIYRTPQKDDWYQYHLQCLEYDDRLLAKSGMRRALTVADLKAAHASKTPIVIQACEGAHWIEGKLERIEEAYKRDLRLMQLPHQMHDLVAPLGGLQQLIVPPGGTQSGTPANVTGLTPFGADVIRECNRLGIVVDMAHADEETVMGALKVTQQPLVVTHTALDSEVARSADLYVGNPGLKARLASKTYAKAVADAGGIMGIWRIFPTVKDYVTGIKQMVDVVGVNHVGIGTDTSLALGVGGPVPGTNNIWPDEKSGFLYSVVQEMLTQGFVPDEISRIVGGNYVRLFGKVTRSAA